MGKPMTIAIVPTWEEIVPLLVEAAANGTTTEGRKAAIDELRRLARTVDEMNARARAEKPIADPKAGKAKTLVDLWLELSPEERAEATRQIGAGMREGATHKAQHGELLEALTQIKAHGDQYSHEIATAAIAKVQGGVL